MIILGYDARERWCPLDRLWPGHRRAAFLLRDDVIKPLSADVFVWPSVFADAQLDILHLEDARLGSAGLPAPHSRFALQDLWNDLGALRRALAPHTDIAYDVVAFTSSRSWPFDVPPCTPAETDATWRSLGFDVTDAWLLSGLANCGYQEDVDAWRSRWGSHLNEHHLFEDETIAREFAAATDPRVVEHAPFQPVEIWLLGAPAAEAAVRASDGG